ncbi:MAG TPA: DUF2141 domain-containing protein [Candidatus Binataceae bacterium]|jgi:uncharacterized protein (DUF2141 family)
MRRAFLALGSAAAQAGLVSTSTEETGERIKAEVVGLHSTDGDVKCARFNGAEGFPADSSKAIKTTSGPIHDGIAECDFDQVPAGEYAIAVYHEENSNGKLDRIFVGIPKEGVGVSNETAGTFDRPHLTTTASPIRVEVRPSPSTSAISDMVAQ